jgi:hypothetical protein
MAPWIRTVPEWWLTSVCLAVEVYARLPISCSWEMAQAIGYEMTGRMVADTRTWGSA